MVLAFGLGALGLGLELLHELDVIQEWIAVGPDDHQIVGPFTRFKPGPQARADETDILRIPRRRPVLSQPSSKPRSGS